MSEIDQENETDENKNGRADKGNVLSPEHEETVGNGKGNED